MSGTRAALVLGAIPITVGVVYWLLDYTFGTELQIDDAGATMLIALGLAMGFATFVVVKGANDL